MIGSYFPILIQCLIEFEIARNFLSRYVNPYRNGILTLITVIFSETEVSINGTHCLTRKFFFLSLSWFPGASGHGKFFGPSAASR